MAKQPTLTPSPKTITNKKHIARLERERMQQRYLVTGAIVVVGLVLALILYGVLNEYVFKQMRPVAQVGSANISTADFQKQVKFSRYQLIAQLSQLMADPIYSQFFGSYIQQMQAQLASPAIIGQQVLDAMIEDELVRQEAERRGITVTEQEVDKRMEEVFGFYPDGTPTPTATQPPVSTATLSPEQTALFPPTSTPTPTVPPTAEPSPTGEAGVTEPTEEPTAEPTATAAAEVDDADASADASDTESAEEAAEPTVTPTRTPLPTATPYTREGYEKVVNDYVQQLRDLGITKEDLRTMLRKELLKQKVFEALTADVETEAEQIWVRHILVDTEEEAKAAYDLLIGGKNFADLAAEISKDPGSKNNGGEYYYFPRGTMVEPFEEAAFNLKIGEISQPVKTEHGYHIIQLLGKDVLPLSSDQLQNNKQKVYEDWLAEAKEAADVKTYDWTSVVPDTPAVPPELMYQQQVPQTLPEGLSLPEESTPEESEAAPEE